MLKSTIYARLSRFIALALPALAAQAAEPVAGSEAMIVCASPEAARVGKTVLRAGGNAFDAAAAVGFALAVTWPEAGNLGGGGFMVGMQEDGTAVSLDFREKAPALAHRDMYLDHEGNVIDGLSLRSALASGVPGAVDGLLHMWRDYGSGEISQADLLVPAIQLAQDGFRISKELAGSLNARRDEFAQHPSAAKVFIRPDDEPWEEGDRFVQPDLASTLQRIAREGREGFYDGKTADLIVQQQARDNGIISYEDLRTYAAVDRNPMRGQFRDYSIVSMGPPSSGGILLIQMLNMLDTFPVETMAHGSTEYVHLLTEVQRRAYADRAEHLGDTDFWDVPIENLTLPEYARSRAADIALTHATPSKEVHAGEPLVESPNTTHYSIVDSEGNAVAVTVTLNASFGSKIVVDGAGFLMNNEMDDFSAKPGVPNLYGVTGGDANAIQPGKRMLSSMTPTIVLHEDKPYLVLGSPGGSTIITTVLQVFLNIVLHDMNIQDAVDAPRHHSQWLPDAIMYEPGAIDDSVREELTAMGHAFVERPSIGAANCILIDETGVYGAPDPRRQSTAVGF